MSDCDLGFHLTCTGCGCVKNTPHPAHVDENYTPLVHKNAHSTESMAAARAALGTGRKTLLSLKALSENPAGLNDEVAAMKYDPDGRWSSLRGGRQHLVKAGFARNSGRKSPYPTTGNMGIDWELTDEGSELADELAEKLQGL